MPMTSMEHTTAAQPLDGGSQMVTSAEPSACKDVEPKAGKVSEPQTAYDSKAQGGSDSEANAPTDPLSGGFSSKPSDSKPLPLSENNLDESFLDGIDLSWLTPVKGEPKREAKFDVSSDGGSQPSTFSSESSLGSQEHEAGEVATTTSNKRKAEEMAQALPVFDPARLFGSFEPPTTNQPALASSKATAAWAASEALPTGASFSNDATTKSSWAQPTPKVGKCHNCVQAGHWASECPFIKSKMLASRESKCALCPFVIKAQKDVIVKLACGPFTYQWVHRACGMEHLVHLGQI